MARDMSVWSYPSSYIRVIHYILYVDAGSGAFKDDTALITLFEVLPNSDYIPLFSPIPITELVGHPRNILELKIKSYNFVASPFPSRMLRTQKASIHVLSGGLICPKFS